MLTPPDFDWCQLETVAGTKNNRRRTQTRSQTAQKNRVDYWCRLLKWANTKNRFLVPAAYVIRYYK
jgi:hypothetical protein